MYHAVSASVTPNPHASSPALCAYLAVGWFSISIDGWVCRPATLGCVLQFVRVLEANIFSKINALVNVTITKVVAGSISVTNSAAFTSSDSAAALAGQSALADVLSSGDVSSIFGTTFGSVTVSGITKGTVTNPSTCAHMQHIALLVICCACVCHTAVHVGPVNPV